MPHASPHLTTFIINSSVFFPSFLCLQWCSCQALTSLSVFPFIIPAITVCYWFSPFRMVAYLTIAFFDLLVTTIFFLIECCCYITVSCIMLLNIFRSSPAGSHSCGIILYFYLCIMFPLLIFGEPLWNIWNSLRNKLSVIDQHSQTLSIEIYE